MNLEQLVDHIIAEGHPSLLLSNFQQQPDEICETV